MNKFPQWLDTSGYLGRRVCHYGFECHYKIISILLTIEDLETRQEEGKVFFPCFLSPWNAQPRKWVEFYEELSVLDHPLRLRELVHRGGVLFKCLFIPPSLPHSLPSCLPPSLPSVQHTLGRGFILFLLKLAGSEWVTYPPSEVQSVSQCKPKKYMCIFLFS